MKNITRRHFLLGAASLAITGIYILSDAKNLAYPILEKPDSQLLKPIDCDLIIENAYIIDGSGNSGFIGSLAIKGDEIVAVGSFPKSRFAEKFDAKGMVVCPGFIDIHTHTENYIHSGGNPVMILAQGVTTQIGGNCGTSPFSTKEYFASLGDIGVNIGLLSGYKSIRYLVMGGQRSGIASPRQVSQMQKKLAEELSAGAFGLSVGLEYYPQNFATTDELIELCKVVKDYNGLYATHLRSESDDLLEAFEEAVTIGQKTSVQVQYSHTKASFVRNWKKYPRVLDMLSQAKSSGVDITADTYYYTFSGWDIGTQPLRHSISEENIELAIIHDLVFFGSDSGLKSGGRATHPRAYGNYPRIIKGITGQKIMPLEKAIYKMTGYPAQRFKIANRGLLKPKMKADIIAFYPEKVKDLATYENPNLLSEGISEVWLNGKWVIKNGQYTGLMAGEPVLRS